MEKSQSSSVPSNSMSDNSKTQPRPATQVPPPLPVPPQRQPSPTKTIKFVDQPVKSIRAPGHVKSKAGFSVPMPPPSPAQHKMPIAPPPPQQAKIQPPAPFRTGSVPYKQMPPVRTGPAAPPVAPVAVPTPVPAVAPVAVPATGSDKEKSTSLSKSTSKSSSTSSPPSVISAVISSKHSSSDTDHETTINIQKAKNQTKVEISEKRSPKAKDQKEKSTSKERPSQSGSSGPVPPPRSQTAPESSLKHGQSQELSGSTSGSVRSVPVPVPASVTGPPSNLERSESIQQKFFVKPFTKPVIASTVPADLQPKVQAPKEEMRIWNAPPPPPPTQQKITTALAGKETTTVPTSTHKAPLATATIKPEIVSKETAPSIKEPATKPKTPQTSVTSTTTDTTPITPKKQPSSAKVIKEDQKITVERDQTGTQKIHARIIQTGTKQSKSELRNEIIHDCTIFILTQFLSLIILMLVAAWLIRHFGGFGYSTPELVFNLHPMLMVLGMIYILANTLLFLTPKRSMNLIRFSLLFVMMALVGLACVTTIYWHFKRSVMHLHSMHSWFGLASLVMFVVYVGAVLRYYGPDDSSVKRLEDALMKLRILGIATLLIATITMLIGINQMEIYMINPGGSIQVLDNISFKKYETSQSRLLVNCVGVFSVVYVVFMIYMASRRRTRSKERQELEDRIQMTVNKAIAQMEASGAFDSPPVTRSVSKKHPTSFTKSISRRVIRSPRITSPSRKSFAKSPTKSPGKSSTRR